MSILNHTSMIHIYYFFVNGRSHINIVTGRSYYRDLSILGRSWFQRAAISPAYYYWEGSDFRELQSLRPIIAAWIVFGWSVNIPGNFKFGISVVVVLKKGWTPADSAWSPRSHVHYIKKATFYLDDCQNPVRYLKNSIIGNIIINYQTVMISGLGLQE